jgi:hypothetical protein
MCAKDRIVGKQGAAKELYERWAANNASVLSYFV